MNSQFLKRAASLVLSGVMITSLLVGCGGGNQTQPSAPPAEQSPAAPDNGGGDKPADEKKLEGELLFWHFNKDEATALAKAFETKYPGVKVKVEITDQNGNAYQDKITNGVRSGKGMPDVYAAEAAYVKRFVNMQNGYEDISAAPYSAEGLLSEVIPYTIDIGRSPDGKMRALSHQGTPGGIGYKRDVAKEVLGTDDPAVLSEWFSSKDKILELAAKCKEKGKVLFPGNEELRKIYLGGRTDPWIKDGKFIMDPKMLEYIELSKALRDMKQDSGMKAWEAPWKSACEDTIHLAYAVPTWGIRWIVGENDKANMEKGRWGVASGPFPYFWGGTWFGVYSKSEKKDLAWAFVKYITTDKDFQKEWAKNTGDFMSNVA